MLSGMFAARFGFGGYCMLCKLLCLFWVLAP